MAVRFGGTKLDCPGCGTVNVQFHKLRERRVYACPHCLFQIAPTANTILHDTRTPLVSWFYAMWLFCTDAPRRERQRATAPAPGHLQNRPPDWPANRQLIERAHSAFEHDAFRPCCARRSLLATAWWAVGTGYQRLKLELLDHSSN